MDRLWEELKCNVAADRQTTSVDDLAGRASQWVLNLAPAQVRRNSGMASGKFWLRSLWQRIWPPAYSEPQAGWGVISREGRLPHRHGPAGPGHRRRQVPRQVARTSRAMTDKKRLRRTVAGICASRRDTPGHDGQETAGADRCRGLCIPQGDAGP
jgi:hypothetical protein